MLYIERGWQVTSCLPMMASTKICLESIENLSWSEPFKAKINLGHLKSYHPQAGRPVLVSTPVLIMDECINDGHMALWQIL